MIYASTDEHADVQIWRNSRGEWHTNKLTTKLTVGIQPYRRGRRELKIDLLRAVGVKRIAYGWWYDITIDSDEFGRFTPVLARPFSKKSRGLKPNAHATPQSRLTHD